MPKKVTDLQKKEILESFINGSSIKEISIIYNFSISTITKQLKNILGEEEFIKIKASYSHNENHIDNGEKEIEKKNLEPKEVFNDANNNSLEKNTGNDSGEYQHTNFYEIEPLTVGVELDNQKDLTSQPLRDFQLPKLVYIIIERELEIKPKLLFDYPEWRFLSKDDLNRYVIEIFSDQKEAKKSCSKNQKLIKVPNPNVFLLASANLKLKGISRIIFGNNLLAL